MSGSGATVWLEPLAVVELANRWREAQLEEEREVERILRRMGDIELAGKAQRNESYVLRGLTSLPIRWTPLG